MYEGTVQYSHISPLFLVHLCRCLCRLCGSTLRKVKGPDREVQVALGESCRAALRRMACRFTTWPEVIRKVFKVDVTADLEAVHPPLFCHRCWMAVMRGGGFCSFTAIRVPKWTPHESLCALCHTEKTSSRQRRGRKRKREKRGFHKGQKRCKWEPFDVTGSTGRRALRPVAQQHHQHHQPGPGLRPQADLRRHWVKGIAPRQRGQLSTTLVSGELPVDLVRSVTCPVCDHLLSEPVQSPCRHLFCYSCIVRCGRTLGPYCPACSLPCTSTDLTVPAKVFLALLNSLPLRCPIRTCGEQVRLDSFGTHWKAHLQEEGEGVGRESQESWSCDGPAPNKGGRPRQHLLSLTRRAQKHRLRDLRSQVKAFAEREEGGDIKAVCLTLFLLALRSENEHRKADELEAIMQGTAPLFESLPGFFLS